MDFSEIYNLENGRLSEIREITNNPDASEEELRKALKTFGDYYEELLRQMQFIITVSDRLEKRIHKFNDTLEQKNQKIDEQNKMLIELNATKDKFFSIIAHDLKNPMQSLILSAHMLHTYFNKQEYERMEKHIQAVDDSVKLSVNLLENLLQWARAQTGRLEVQKELFPIQHSFNESIDLLKKTALDKKITIKVQSSNEDINAYADRNMVTTVVRNLLSNALKFSFEGSEILIDIKGTSHSVIVQIADKGMGIEKEAVKKLFRIDQNHSTPGTNNERGTGLGLVLCKEFIESNDGDIWVKSSVGEGSFFFFSLPAKEKNKS